MFHHQKKKHIGSPYIYIYICMVSQLRSLLTRSGNFPHDLKQREERHIDWTGFWFPTCTRQHSNGIRIVHRRRVLGSGFVRWNAYDFLFAFSSPIHATVHTSKSLTSGDLLWETLHKPHDTWNSSFAQRILRCIKNIRSSEY